MSDMAQLLLEAEPLKQIRRGDVIVGEVMRIDQDGILVNTGHKSEGMVPTREMRSLSPEALNAIQAGDEIFTYVVRPDTDEGPAILSLDRARGEQGWLTLQKYLDSNTSLEGVIRGFNRGGAVV